MAVFSIFGRSPVTFGYIGGRKGDRKRVIGRESVEHFATANPSSLKKHHRVVFASRPSVVPHSARPGTQNERNELLTRVVNLRGATNAASRGRRRSANVSARIPIESWLG